jgi:exodeoxyribonuclease-3
VKIATWNVNSIRIRVDAAVAWLKEAQPDVVALQELKCTDDQFPKEPFEALGYNCAVHGQKTYNGVAILSKRPMEDVTPRLPGGDGDDHARYL